MARIMIVAGEASGDMHAGRLVRAVRDRDPSMRFFGIGGPNMREAGTEILVDSGELAVVGLIEVLAHYRVIKAALDRMRAELRRQRPDLLILTDYPDFNLRLAKTAKALGIPVLYYISPQVWAWRQGRVKTIRERVDMMAVVFEFEEAFYGEHQVPARFVGHPLVDEVEAEFEGDTKALVRELGWPESAPVFGLFPGSRRSEVKQLLPTILGAAERVHAARPEARFLLPLASSLKDEDIRPYLTRHAELDIAVVPGRGYEVMRACDAIATVSGTVTLEIALIGTPMVITYRVSPLTYALVKRMLKIPYVGLCNIVAGQRVAPEALQADATPERIADELLRIVEDPGYAAEIRKGLAQVRGKLGGSGGSENAAALVLEMLERSSRDAATSH